jgi:hypothetical protein
MRTLLGFALGFYLGTKVGPKWTDELLKTWQTIKESEDFKALSATARAVVENLIEQGEAGVARLAAVLIAEGIVPESESAAEAASPTGESQGLWAAVSESPEVQGLVSAGTALVMQFLEQGITAARGRI